MAISDLTFPAVQELTSSSASIDRLQQIGARAASGKEMSDKEIKEVGQQFEAMLLHQLLSAMRKSIPKNELFGESSASEIYRDLFDEKIAEQVARASQTGIGEALAQEIKEQQEQVLPSSTSPRMIPLKGDESTFRTLQGEEQSWKPIKREEPVLRAIPDQNPRFMPIRVKSGSANKVNIVG